MLRISEAPNSSQVQPRAERPRFSLWELLLATTLIAIYLGLLRWIGPLALYFAVVLWVALLFKQLDSNMPAAARIAAQVWGGVVVPSTLLFFMMSLFSKMGGAPKLVIYLYAIWTGGIATWLICQFVYMPRLAAMVCGFLTVVGGTFAWFGFLMAMAAIGNPHTDTSTFLQIINNFVQMFAYILAGFVVGFTYFAAAVQAWRKSRRSAYSGLLAFAGGCLAFFGVPALALLWL